MKYLPDHFLKVPFAHRGLHDIASGRAENSLAAIQAAIDAGYGVEIDIQSSRDSHAMVFHDYDLGRMTVENGSIHLRDCNDLRSMQLLGSREHIPTLHEALALVDGQVPVLIEIKDQHGAMGPTAGELERAIARDLANYRGQAAVMSFNPYSVEMMAELLPEVPRGLVTGSFLAESWALLPKKTREKLRAIPDFDSVGASFISHNVDDLDRPRVAEIRAAGSPVLCWTVKDANAEAEARAIADNITFEGYMPKQNIA